MTGQEPKKRRTNVTEEQIREWIEMEAAGKKRSEIAKEKGYNPSVITRHLGKRVKDEVQDA